MFRVTLHLCLSIDWSPEKNIFYIVVLNRLNVLIVSLFFIVLSHVLLMQGHTLVELGHTWVLGHMA